MENRRLPARGWTLTEVMVVVAIMGILTTMAPNIMIQMTRFFRQNRARVEIQRDARTALDIINRNLRQAQASTVTVSQQSGQPPYSRVDFTKYSGTTTAKLAFYQSGTELVMVSVGTRTISKNLRYLSFTYPRTDDDNIVSVSITMETGSYEGKTKALQLSVEKVRIMND
ncbi:MAG: prepilin-type N-terminal cleavage/methylation domain-containing protein [Elusimicrobiota bacterium]